MGPINSSTAWMGLDITSSPPVLADDLDRVLWLAAQDEEYPKEWQSALEPDTGYTLYYECYSQSINNGQIKHGLQD